MEVILQPIRANIERAARALLDGSLIGLPTETVYGLAADAENETAVRRIYQVKGRPLNHPIIVHIGKIDYLENWAIDIPDYARKLATRFWPGPMTLILKRTNLAKDFVTGGQDSVGIRVPKHPVTQSILNEFHKLNGKGLAAPSANKFEAVSPTDAFSVIDELGKELKKNKDFVVDGGNSEIGIESTIINCLHDKPEILRKGAITKKDIESLLKTTITKDEKLPEIRFSGKLTRHYSPKARILVREKPKKGDGFIALSCVETPEGCLRLANPKSSEEFAGILYSSFRLADHLGLARLIVIPPDGDGIELAILERLVKASR